MFPSKSFIILNMMKTPFTKDMFKKDGKYLLLQGDHPYENRVYKQSSEFLARFKYNGPVTMAKFIKELINSWTVEDYLYQLNVNRKAPFRILKEKNPSWYNQIQSAWLRKQTRV